MRLFIPIFLVSAFGLRKHGAHMNFTVLPSTVGRTFILGLALLTLAGTPVAGLAADSPATVVKENQPNPADFSPLGAAVLELLRSGNAAQFAANFTPSVADRQANSLTNLPAWDAAATARAQGAVESERGKNEAGAREVVKTAAALHLDFSQGDWHARVILPEHLDQAALAGQQQLPWTEQVDIVLESGTNASQATNGSFKLVVRGLLKYPGGWRFYDGIQWAAFPANVGDDQLRRKLAIMARAAANQGLNGQDDPALLALGETLVHFIRERDPAIFEQEAYVAADLVWAQLERSGRKGPTRQEFDEMFGARAEDQLELARAVVKQLDDAGIDLKNADIQLKAATVGRVMTQGAAGSLDGLMGSQFKLTLAVTSPGKAKNGTSLSGEYSLSANMLRRFEHDWKVEDNLHWYQLPEGIVASEVAARMRYENYVSEHHTLPPQTAAPEIELITLDGEKTMKLSDFKGKVVVLDFWATWCGPCQQPMADLQQLRDKHPDWQDRVVIVPLSIDDTLEAVRKHVAKRDWTNTFNVWAGEGGWRSQPPKTFRVTGVPTTYILDADGKIVIAGHPAALPIEATVEHLLKPY